MRILDSYIAKNVVVTMLVVLFVLLSLFTLFGFIDELKDVGKGNYNIGKAMLFVLMTLPSLAYQLLPMTALLGCTIGLGLLASNSELTAIRSAGVSLERIIWSVLKVGIAVVLLGILVGEWLAPQTEQFAQTMRSVAKSSHLSLKGKQGLWAKDGTQYINVRKILPGQRLGDVYVYEVDHEHHVTHVLYAKSASYDKDQWVLENVKHTYFVKGKVIAQAEDRHEWKTVLSPDLLNVVTVRPNTLSIRGLYQYIQYLDKNNLSADQYRQTFWTKAILPVVIIIMMMLAIPFVFGPLRSVGAGHRILVGSLVGIGFHLLSQMFSYLGLVLEFKPVVSAMLPAMLASVLVIYLMRRVH